MSWNACISIRTVEDHLVSLGSGETDFPKKKEAIQQGVFGENWKTDNLVQGSRREKR